MYHSTKQQPKIFPTTKRQKHIRPNTTIQYTTRLNSRLQYANACQLSNKKQTICHQANNTIRNIAWTMQHTTKWTMFRPVGVQLLIKCHETCLASLTEGDEGCVHINQFWTNKSTHAIFVSMFAGSPMRSVDAKEGLHRLQVRFS